MKKSIEERAKAKLLAIGKKNKVFRVLVIPALFTELLFFHICSYLRSNKKRLAVLAVTFFVCPVFSSFSFPSFMMGPDAEAYSPDAEGLETISLAQESALNMDEVEEASPSESKETPVFSRDDWRLVLINKQNSIPDDYSFTLGTIKGNMQCDERIIEDVLDMLQAAGEDGIKLTICSPYRDMERQEMLFERKIKRYMNKGMSYMEAYQLASEAVTVPGASEHQIGLALDIVCNEYTALDEGFGETEAGKWLAENSCKYGFILRYPSGKEYITGIEYEPWHFRYVGSDAATLIMEQGITLEEFWEEYL